MPSAPCKFCNDPVTVGAIGEWRLVEGLARNREGAGAHGLTRAKELHLYAHNGCMDLKLIDKDRLTLRFSGTFECTYCHVPVQSNAIGAGLMTRGWAQFRPEGGINAVSLRQDQGTGACAECMHKLITGNDPGQASLL